MRTPLRALCLSLLLAGGTLLALGAAGATGAEQPQRVEVEAASKKTGKSGKRLRATIRRTKYGVPHVTAPNMESLAAGYAYAYARDNICTIANEYVTVAAQRSKYFGPDETWFFSGNGSTYRNLDADFYFKWVEEQGTVRDLMSQPPPLGPKRGVRRGVKGYVAGYNAYLRRTGVDNLPDPACRGADWVREIRQRDVYRRFYQLGILASSGAVIDGIVGASPVSPAAAVAGDARREEMLRSGEGLDKLQPQVGSNAYGFGRETTSNGKGVVLGNPHFPWDGAERLYQAHLRIPGKVNVAGASLNGVPLILIGHTRGLAWSHTVATAWRFTPFKLTLPPGDRHSYIVDGEIRPMQRTEVSVPVRTPDGGIERRSHTIYSTEYGPMIDNLVGIPLPWTEGTGFALADVNATNFRYLNHFFDNNKAQTVREYHRIQRRYQGIPWVNSIAADSRGESYYTMQGAIPFVPDEHAAQCNVLAPVYQVLGLPVLDGARSECNWRSSPDATAEGTFPPGKVPAMFRDDYVHNGNDSHWLTNAKAPMTGFDRIIGIENAERTYRTRIGLVQVEERLAGADGLPGNRFNRKLLQQVMLGNRQYLGELMRDRLVTLCETAPGGFLLGSSGPVNVSGACGPLREWDLRDDLDSAGAMVFRRFASRLISNFPGVPTGLQGGMLVGSETLWTTPYSNSDPVHTPRGLNIANPLVIRALADGVTDLNDAGIPLDAGLRGYQFDVRGGKRIPIHGGPGGLGVFNAIGASWRPDEGGYAEVPHGASFVMSAQFVDGRCPVKAGTFVTYGQTENQTSRHASDYTRAFSRKRWNQPPFCQRDVKRAARSTQRVKFRKRPGPR
jgi:acyl-homoserine-lactone acylase